MVSITHSDTSPSNSMSSAGGNYVEMSPNNNREERTAIHNNNNKAKGKGKAVKRSGARASPSSAHVFAGNSPAPNELLNDSTFGASTDSRARNSPANLLTPAAANDSAPTRTTPQSTGVSRAASRGGKSRTPRRGNNVALKSTCQAPERKLFTALTPCDDIIPVGDDNSENGQECGDDESENCCNEEQNEEEECEVNEPVKKKAKTKKIKVGRCLIL